MSALALHVRALRRARRWLPAALAPVALLPPRAGRPWQASPLSCLPLGGAAAGRLGLRLPPSVATELAAGGLDWLGRVAAAWPPAPGAAVASIAWRHLHCGSRRLFWARAGQGLSLVLDPADASAWLLWKAKKVGAKC